MAATRNVITRDPDVLGGTPVFRGTRVPFQALLDYLKGGQTLNDFLDDSPTVTREAAIQAFEHVKSLVADDIGFSAALNAGLAAADRGDFVEHEKVGDKLKKILRP